MPDTPSIVLVKKFTYRGQREEVSNKYHFSGTVPSDDNGWKALADAMIASERTIVTSKTAFVRAYGYEAGNELSVAQIDYEAAPLTPAVGTLGYSNTEVLMQPESAVTVRWRTAERNTRKKWIYLRKYIHGGICVASDGESIPSSYMAALNAWAGKLTDGSLPGGFKYCGPQGAAAGAVQVNPYATTRELTRRGKRPSR